MVFDRKKRQFSLGNMNFYEPVFKCVQRYMRSWTLVQGLLSTAKRSWVSLLSLSPFMALSTNFLPCNMNPPHTLGESVGELMALDYYLTSSSQSVYEFMDVFLCKERRGQIYNLPESNLPQDHGRFTVSCSHEPLVFCHVKATKKVSKMRTLWSPKLLWTLLRPSQVTAPSCTIHTSESTAGALCGCAA